jgi:hypothetical protein
MALMLKDVESLLPFCNIPSAAMQAEDVSDNSVYRNQMSDRH